MKREEMKFVDHAAPILFLSACALLTLPPATEIVEATAPIAAALGVAGLTWSIVAWRRIAVYGRVLIGIGLLLIFAALIVPSLL